MKDDLGWIMTLRNLPENTFDRTYEVLFQQFWNPSENHTNLEKVIVTEIEWLKKREYRIDIDNDTLEYITITIEDIEKMLVSMREQRIDFYKAILEEYRKRKSEYDERMKKKN